MKLFRLRRIVRISFLAECHEFFEAPDLRELIDLPLQAVDLFVQRSQAGLGRLVFPALVGKRFFQREHVLGNPCSLVLFVDGVFDEILSDIFGNFILRVVPIGESHDRRSFLVWFRLLCEHSHTQTPAVNRKKRFRLHRRPLSCLYICFYEVKTEFFSIFFRFSLDFTFS